MKKLTTPLLFLAFVSSPAFALETPAAGEYDDRVKYVDYNPAEVVKLVGHYGYSTHIQFARGEAVQQIAMGDKLAWEVAPVDNHIFIKPRDKEATTNMTVLTSRRAYNFELNAHWSQMGAHSNDMYFQVSFNYPEEEAARERAEEARNEVERRMDSGSNLVARNWNYWAKGSESVTPNRAVDDGRFTYLTFAANRSMPAVYIINDDGSESLVNTHIDPDRPGVIVVEKIARQLVLRKGQSVACLFNESYDPDGIANHTGTTIEGVKRGIKGREK
ncbi:P-type conjugative transfer protein VirB9 (plasmid) [Guyparkeria sp. 1SP6A2]|nr:P-type conjugative transfer protein VirB9 [Guyparkeria sp. 1SP6A2]